ncbi:MAG: glycosyltransferase family 4 protein [Alkalibacterium sp.]|nr:glycosyltransferase family 4 protein [Alkalibacterium sp.]
MTAGRLTEVKGNVILLRALSKAGFKDWRWIICGEGEGLDELRQLASVNKLTDHLFFKGWLTSSELRSELCQADVFVLPSLSEGFPLVLLEAADQKVPVIATDVGDVKEVITDQRMGWLIPSDNEEALTEALNEAHELWENHQLAEMGEQLKRWATRFSIEKQTESVQKFYTETRAENRR